MSKIRIPVGILVVSVLLNITARFWQDGVKCYVNKIFPLWVETYGRLTGLFPFSAGEIMLYTGVFLILILIIATMFRFFFLRGNQGLRKLYGVFCTVLFWIFSMVCLVLTLNCFILYQVPSIDDRMELAGKERQYGVQEIAAVRDYVTKQCNALAKQMERDEKGYILSNLDMEQQAREEMQNMSEAIPNLRGYYPRPKKLLTSRFFSQQYIMGYYFPFSMEANYNGMMYITNVPMTLCHELSHLKGYILEDEANFIGYLACVHSDEALFQYSGYLGVLGYLDQDFYRAIGEDPAEYARHPQISRQVIEDDMFLTEEAWEEVEGKAFLSTDTVKQVSKDFTETTLTMNGVKEGMISYSEVVKLLLRYYDGVLY